MQCPSSVAIEVIADGQRSLMSYEEMDAHSTNLSIILQQVYGIGLGNIVPIFVDQTVDLLMAVNGILKAGAGYQRCTQFNSIQVDPSTWIALSSKARN